MAMYQPELDAQSLIELNAKLNKLPVLAAADSKALKTLVDQTDLLEMQLTNLQNQLNQANNRLNTLSTLISETYDVQIKKNEALDLLIAKLKQ